MRQYAVLLVALIASWAAAIASSMPPELTTPVRLFANTPTITGPLSGRLDTETITSPVAYQQGQGHVYYVATNGNDNNPGTEAQPFRTIAKGASPLGPGDTLYIRGGIYYEQVDVTASGTADEQVTIAAYPGEQPVIDAQNTLPVNPDGCIIVLRGNYITLSGIEIKSVHGTAVLLRGSYNIVRNMKIHHCLKEGIYVGAARYCSNGISNTHNIVENNEIWMTSLMHEGITDGGTWSGAISVGRCPQNTIVRRNIVHETWGIGITAYEAYSTTLEDNVVWNNQLEHYYVNNAPYTLVQRNMSYNTPDSVYLYRGGPGVGIAFCDEKPWPVSHHVSIVNNLVLRGNRGFYFFSQQAGSGLKNFLIANNTFVDNTVLGLQIVAGGHENSRIHNNIFAGEGAVARVASDPDLSFSYNLWSKVPPASASGAGDMIGDPRLARSGSTDPGLLDPDWFKLLPDSPAIDSGIPLIEVPDDFDGVHRPRGTGYDIGAYESPFSVRVTDLHVVAAVGDMPSLTVTLRWTAPVMAVTYILRSSNTLLTPANWSNASIVTVPFTASEPGSIEWLTTPIEYTGGTLYLALKSQKSTGDWSELSNNAFWPHVDLYLPLIIKTTSSHRQALIGIQRADVHDQNCCSQSRQEPGFQ